MRGFTPLSSIECSEMTGQRAIAEREKKGVDKGENLPPYTEEVSLPRCFCFLILYLLSLCFSPLGVRGVFSPLYWWMLFHQ